MSFNKIVKEVYGRYNGICPTLLVLLHLILERFCSSIVKLCCPIDELVVVFRSMPDYSDNARALADYMVENGYTKKYKIYFDVENINRYSNRHENITFISCKAKYGRYKLKSLYRLFTAKYLMSTHNNIIDRKRARKKQFLIRLWHGCSFKDRSIYDGIIERNFNFALVPGELFVKTKAYFWNVSEEYILPLGYPRYDWLRMKDSSAQTIIEAYKKNSETKVVLWMPTFRIDKDGKLNESNSITQFPLMDNIIKWKDLDECCIENNIVIIVKLHPSQAEYKIPFDSFSNIKKIDNQVFDDTDIPLYKFIALTDALISDYSSIGVDYLIVDRPMAFTLDDYEEYKKTRGFIIEDPRIYMPGHHLYTYKELKGFVSDISEGKDSYKEQRKRMLGTLITPSDNYCKSILDKLGIRK
jgi:CDP-glycerol glycerophosphotransferase (TagB/SpsB family)